MAIAFSLILAAASLAQQAIQEPVSYSGVYPHLAFFNDENECGTGAIVPWAGHLWVVTYAPHAPRGSSDKLYEITPDLQLIIRPESIGGTPANRMIHRESEQLFIGPYAIDSGRKVRVIPYSEMLGRPTGNARHLTDPAGKIYYATMEEGLYEVDVKTLEVTELYADTQANREPRSGLPGYHGKGLYSGQGRLVYANNGEQGKGVFTDPFTASGVLAQWDGKNWEVVQRNQFTEITGPGGIFGSERPDQDPIWSIGWDAKSLILMLLEDGQWHKYRLPKASHSYDGAHGWNTEWPRIRDIGEDDLLMTMHGMFWRFPRTFSTSHSSGVTPRSSYLKVVGDFCRWQNKIVLGCDDTAKSEFNNKRKAKGVIAAPQSQSNLWFLEPEQLDQLGQAFGHGAVWLNEPVVAGIPSDPYLFSGFKRRAVHLFAQDPTSFTFEVDANGDGQWTELLQLDVHGYLWHSFDKAMPASWIRVRSSVALANATAWFDFSQEAKEWWMSDPTGLFGLARPGDESVTGGIIRARGGNERSLHFAARDSGGKLGHYILSANMQLKADGDAQAFSWLEENAAIPSLDGVLEVDQASVLYIDDNGRRFRLPKSSDYSDPNPLGYGRLCREVATERDLFNCHGTFFELPANNAGGFARIRPIATHGAQITDFCSYRGLLVLSGINSQHPADNRHIIQSEDGKTALWVGAIDDIWKFGKPKGSGGPWMNTKVDPDTWSDPYLMTGYDNKLLALRLSAAATITAQVDITGLGDWQIYQTFELKAGETQVHTFPEAFQAYWIRFQTDAPTTATAHLIYH